MIIKIIMKVEYRMWRCFLWSSVDHITTRLVPVGAWFSLLSQQLISNLHSRKSSLQCNCISSFRSQKWVSQLLLWYNLYYNTHYSVRDPVIELSNISVHNSTDLLLGQTLNVFLCIAELQNTETFPMDGFCSWSISVGMENITYVDLQGCDPLQDSYVRWQ